MARRASGTCLAYCGAEDRFGRAIDKSRTEAVARVAREIREADADHKKRNESRQPKRGPVRTWFNKAAIAEFMSLT